jgi:hypothetical protein
MAELFRGYGLMKVSMTLHWFFHDNFGGEAKTLRR